MEAPVFLLFSLAVGYLMYWAVVNDTRDPNGGYEGWFAIKPPPKEPGSPVNGGPDDMNKTGR